MHSSVPNKGQTPGKGCETKASKFYIDVRPPVKGGFVPLSPPPPNKALDPI